MTKGLVRANNLADLSSKQDSIVNLGLAIADYDSLKSLYTTAGLDFSIIGGIAGSTGNYQAQIDGISSTLSGIVLSGFVNRQGNGSISTSWTNSDGIISISGVLSGYSPSSGTTFALSIEQGEAVITTSGLSANDLAYNSFRQANSTVVRASPPSGFNTLQLIPLQVGGQSFFVQASETPSFHIAPARMGHALDLVTGNLLGTYNSASPAWAVGPDGVLFQPAANAPVIEYDPTTLSCLGARIWGAVTNRIRNNTMVGAVAGTPGTLPTNWLVTTRGLTQTIVGTGTLNGVNYIDIRMNGTTTQAGPVEIRCDGIASITGISASQSWAQSAWIAIVGGSTSNITNARLIFNEYSAGPTYLRTATNASNILSQGASFVRVGGAITTGASTTIGEQILLLDTAGSGVAIDITLRIGLPQLEQSGTVGPVVKTTTTAASSTADVWTITGADFSRIWNQSEVTFYADATRDVVPATDFPVLIDARHTNGFEVVQCSYLTETVAGLFAMSSNVIQAELYSTGLSGIRIRRVAAAFAQDNFATCANGGTVLTDSSGTMPSPDRINLGSVSSAQFLNGYIRELAIFRSRRPNANLQAMTQ